MRSSRSSLASFTAVLAGGALVLAGCGGGEAPQAGGSASTTGGIQLVNAGKLTLCTHLEYKPFEYRDSGSGKVVGFDIDIVEMVAKDMGLAAEAEVVDVPFDQIWSGAALAAKKCDLGIAGMTITPERANTVLFSDPYFDATQALLTKKGSGITNLAQLKGKNLGVQTDTTGQKYAEDNAEANGYNVVVFEDLPTTVNAVRTGRVDAAINDNGVLLDFAKENTDTQVVAEFNTGEQYGVAFAKDGGQALATEFNKVLKAARSDGRYDASYQKWLGTAPTGAASTAPGAGASTTGSDTGAPTSSDGGAPTTAGTDVPSSPATSTN